ncbi:MULTISPECIES: diguanylate cyclase [Sulfurimonas]|uniref:GGDEF domain-containing protein n=1 Tax=Sulfurimonas TaxID=202746 RepID=UPI0012645723|nr:diguanylate cyclase [Sulfurimonas indica]
MLEGDLYQYLAAVFALLFFISLYFNFRFFKTIKRHNENDNALIRSAYFNPVSDLPNRANIELVLSEQIERALRHNQTFLITVIKIMNYHDVKIRSKELADEFMYEASNRLLSSIRDEDIVGHITDDGFIIVFNEYLDEKNYHIIIDRIKVAFSEKPHINTKYHIEYNLSIGYSKYPNDGTDAKLLIDRATRNALK